MEIRCFWAKGYRSLRDVTVDGIGSSNVFYGRNGAGKSNLLDALRALTGLVRVRARQTPLEHEQGMSWEQLSLWLVPDDRCKFDQSKRVCFGAHVVPSDDERSVIAVDEF